MSKKRINFYPGVCNCGQPVPANAGFWRDGQVFCKAHEPSPATPAHPASNRPLTEDGREEIVFPRTAPVDPDSVAAKVADKVADHFMRHVPAMVEDHAKLALHGLPELVKSELAKLTRVAAIQVGKAPKVEVESAHAMLPNVVQMLAAGASPFLVGPAGSGKTTLAQQCATVLKRKFYMAARVTSEFKLTGFVDANGKTVRTQFREAYEHGGLFLFDEVDASDPDALTTFNAALANGMADFPDGMVARHKDFVAIAAGNTYGRGADRQYVGRNQLDAATLDRFQIVDVDYDEMLELELAGNVEWTRYVQKVRAKIQSEKIRHIVSPRASIMGARLLASGMDKAFVCEATIWKGLPSDQRARVETFVGAF